MHPLEYKYQPPAKINGDVIVMLGGGATLDTPNLYGKGHLSGAAANRLLTCIQLYRKLQVPIILAGGQVTKTTGIEAEIAKMNLIDVGVLPNHIMIENKSRNTTENARYTKKIFVKYRFNRPIIVTSAFHMPRAVKQFAKVGIKVIPFPTDYRTNASARIGFSNFKPSAEALQMASMAIKEYIGLFAAKWY